MGVDLRRLSLNLKQPELGTAVSISPCSSPHNVPHIPKTLLDIRIGIISIVFIREGDTYINVLRFSLRFFYST
jgi:hypothetical protein